MSRSSTSSSIDLSTILTPELYDDILDVRFPWEGEADIKSYSKWFFGGAGTDKFYEVVYKDALKPISELVPTIPDLMEYLPPPNSPDFPEEALALLQLLDQAPRVLFTGMNTRYTNGYFDLVTQHFITTLIEQKIVPDDTARWQALGYSFWDAIIRKHWFYIPYIHSENIQYHEYALRKYEEMRQEIEKYTNTKDPHRVTMEADLKDVFLFQRLFTSEDGPPSTSFSDFFYWFFRVLTAHYPIIKKFGRYPYRNDSLGRETTEEEKEWLLATENFGAPNLTQDQIKRLKEQVKAGIWEKLRDEDVRKE